MKHNKDKHHISTIRLLMGLGLFFVSNVVFGNLIYEVNRTIGSGSVIGTIETDGTIGPIDPFNFIDWSLTLSVPPLTTTLTLFNSFWIASAFPMTATIDGLYFDFSATPGSSAFLLGDSVWPVSYTHLTLPTIQL